VTTNSPAAIAAFVAYLFLIVAIRVYTTRLVYTMLGFLAVSLMEFRRCSRSSPS